MTRRIALRCALVALVMLLAWLGSSIYFVRAEENNRMLRVQVSVRPEGLIEAGDVVLSFSIENVSDQEARNVYLASADGLIFEPVGQIAPGETRSFSRQHSVTERELEDGEISYTISYDDPLNEGVKINYGVRAQIRRSDAQPAVEFTRQFSSRDVEEGDTLTITYRLRNTGNVPLTELQVQDVLGGYIGRVERLEVGDSRTLINRTPISVAAASAPRLSYRAEGSEETREETLAEVPVRIASAELTNTFSADYSAFSRSSAIVVLTLTNTGNVGYRDLCVIDDLYGGVIADELTLPAGGEPLEISRGYAVRGEQGFRWRVIGRSESGAKVDFVTDTVSLPAREVGTGGELRLNVRVLTPRIRHAGDVTLRVLLENPGGVELRDVVISEETLGDLHSFVVLPADGTIRRDFTLHVSDNVTYKLSARGTDADGATVDVYANPIEVIIAADGVTPQGERQLIEFSGGSIKVGGSTTFAVLLIAGFTVLLILIVALIIASHRSRKQREAQVAESRRRREELGKTGRISPVRAQKTRSKGRNS